MTTNRQWIMIWLAVSLALTLISSLILINRAPRWGFVDVPDERKIHLTPTPRTGGLAMIIGSLATFAIYLGSGQPWPSIPWQTLASGAGFMILGGLDDRFGFHPRGKFGWFVLLALLAAWPWAFTGAANAPYVLHLGERMLRPPAWLAYPVLTAWFLSVPNAVNIEDAINGYMGGFSLIMLSVAFLLGVSAPIPMGALVAFLLLNWPKAKHFLGDAGSFGCGFMIAETVLRAGGNQKPLLILVLTAPISLDVAMGIIRRVRLKMSIFQADRATCPHRLVNLCGNSHTWATLILWANALIVSVFALRSIGLGADYLALYAASLVILNWTPLFKSPSKLIPHKLGKALD